MIHPARKANLSVYLVTDAHLTRASGLVETALAAVRGGATIVQLRDPAAKGRALVDQARALVAALRPLGVPLIVNDRADVALAADADGLHVGQGDLHPRDARALIGPDRLLGLSVTTAAQLAGVDPAVVDHIGIGPLFSVDPRTKPDASAPIGLDGFAILARRSPVPAVAIGGVRLEHAAAVIRAGGAGVAVVSAICGQDDPEAAARALREAVRGEKPPGHPALAS